MKNNRFCISKKLVLLTGFFVVALAVVYLVNIVVTKQYPIDSKALDSQGLCSRYGLHELSNEANNLLKSYCDKNSNKYQYGGGWGDNATCYSQTKVCATSRNCKSEYCLRCLNEKVEISKCIAAGKAPSNVLSKQISCPPEGKSVYGWGEGNKCYLLKGEKKERSSDEPYCANKIVDDNFCLYTNFLPNNTGNYNYCIENRSDCFYKVRGTDKKVSYNELLEGTDLKCGCDKAGKYRYSTLIKVQQ